MTVSSLCVFCGAYFLYIYSIVYFLYYVFVLVLVRFFVAFVDSIYKSHRTTHCGDKGPAGMDRGPRGPHDSCATFREQRVDMQSMWRQGSLRHPSPTLRRLLTMAERTLA